VLKKYKLVKKVTEDGFFDVHDAVPLGKIYEANPATICIREFYNISRKVVK